MDSKDQHCPRSNSSFLVDDSVCSSINSSVRGLSNAMVQIAGSQALRRQQLVPVRRLWCLQLCPSSGLLQLRNKYQISHPR